MRVAVIQQSNTPQRDANQAKSTRHIREAAARGAKLVLLQELHTSLYFCQTEDPGCFDLAESIPGPTTDWLSALSAELGIVIVGSLFERRASGLYHNTAVVLDADGSLAGRYRKMHIPDDPGFYEKFYFTPGDSQTEGPAAGFLPIQTSVGKLGVLVCWDQWYPEAARLMALAGAELLLYPTAIGWDPADSSEEKQRQQDAWITIQRAHSIANGLPVLVANRTGHEDSPGGSEGILFWGTSFVAGPQGELLALGDISEEGALIADIDMSGSERVRRIWPFLRDRRIDAYADILRRFRD